MQLPLTADMYQYDQSTLIKCPHSGKLKAPLKFLTLTTNPDVERRLAANRRKVRSNAIRHAIRHGRRTVHNLGCVPNGEEISIALEDAGPNAILLEAQEPASSARTLTRPHLLWPNGTTTAAACSSTGELSLIACRQLSLYSIQYWPPLRLTLTKKDLDRIQSHYSIFSKLLDSPYRYGDLVAMILQSRVVYHATLYTATMQRFKRSSASHDLRSPLYHEGYVLRSVQNAIAQAVSPTDETIFATALLGMSQVSQTIAGTGIPSR